MKRLRLSVYRSNKYIYGQILDDEGKTMLSVSDLNNLGDPSNSKSNKTDRAREVGKLLAKKALEKKISQVIFDRKRFRYHGRVKALAEGAREGGLKF